MQLKILLTGATGFVGEGVLLTCLEHPQIGEVLMINRRHFALQHPKLRELIVPDFMDLNTVTNQLAGYDACFFCAGLSGVNNVRLDEPAYTRITHDITLHVAKTLLALNPDLIFIFISSFQADSSEKGPVMWARVKGKTENKLTELPFKAVYNFRPGGMKAAPGQKNTKISLWFIVGLIGWLFPGWVLTLQEVGLAMINAVLKGYPKLILEINDIRELARR